MGHIRLGRLPRTRKWDQVVSLLLADRSSVEIAAASAAAAESALRKAHADSAFGYAFWLLTQIPLAARSPNFNSSLQKLGLRTAAEPTVLAVVGAFTEAVDRRIKEVGGRTDFGEMAQLAAAESLSALAGRDLPSLFSPTPDDVKLALGRLAAPNRFAMLAREFFSRLTARYLDYFLSREISNHVGPARRLRSTDDHTGFNEALEQHCREASRIVEAFAGGCARIGGRHLRSRLFSTEEVYKAALTNELVKLGLAPSSASGAVNELWERWDKREVEGRKIYAVLARSDEEWTALLCWQKISGGPLYKTGKSAVEIKLPKQASAVLPISDVLERVTNQLLSFSD